MLLFINNRSYFIKSYQLLNDYTIWELKSMKISMHYIFGKFNQKIHFSFSSLFPLFSLFSLSPSPSWPNCLPFLPPLNYHLNHHLSSETASTSVCWTLVDFDDTKILILSLLIKLIKCFRDNNEYTFWHISPMNT